MLSNPFFWIGALALFYMLAFLWPEQSICIARNKLFKVRAIMFNTAAEGTRNLSLEDPMYKEARETINEIIRYAHNFDLIAGIIGFIHSKRSKDRDPHKKSLKVTVSDDASEEQRDKAKAYNRFIFQALLVMTWLMVSRQPLLVPVLMVLGMILAVSSIVSRRHSSPRKKLRGGVSRSLAWGMRA